MYKMCESIAEEISKIADKGLTTSNLETAYKLIDMYKDLKTVEAMEGDGYSQNGYSMNGYDNGNSYVRRGEHYVRGHYSRDNGDNYSRYSQAKYDYRHSRADGDKMRIMDSLEDYMQELTDKLEDMINDSDSQEERQTIQRYITKIKSIK